jgi:hypothetical protein
MQKALNGNGTPIFSKEEFRTSQIANIFGTLFTKQQHEKVLDKATDVVNEMPHCVIAMKTNKGETKMKLCKIDETAWVKSQKLNTLTIAA